ncbi:MAG: riboflavin kinase [bacterium]|nr:riboflavin kinase [bacterium]
MKKPLLVQEGKVERGTKMARKVGYPTVNIHYDDVETLPGTYAGKVVVEDMEYHAAVYVNQKRQVLEAHLLDISLDLYGKEITVILLERLVEAKAFRGRLDEQSFIEWAVKEVRKYFNERE